MDDVGASGDSGHDRQWRRNGRYMWVSGLWLGLLWVLETVLVLRAVGEPPGGRRVGGGGGEVPDAQVLSLWITTFVHPGIVAIPVIGAMAPGRVPPAVWFGVGVVASAAVALWPPSADAEVLRPALVAGAAGLAVSALLFPGRPD